MNYLTKMTVKDLREIATRMDLETALRNLDLPKINRAKKADLIKVITYGIEDDLVEALAFNDYRDDIAKENALTAPKTIGEVIWMIYKGIGNGKRTQNYVRQNGSHKLTPAQNRRINKKGNREFGYSTKNLQVLTNA